MRIVIIPLSSSARFIVAQRTLQHATVPRFDDRIAKRVHDTWTKWEASSTWWKKRVTTWGNAALANTPYEEWSLKNVPRAPAGLFPSVPRRWWQAWRWGEAASEQESLLEAGLVSLAYPPGLVHETEAAEIVRRFADERSPYHLKYMLLSLLGSPLTLPVALIPIIPNIPGFYMLYRAWSHWKGAQLLKRIINEKKYELAPSAALASVYASEPPMSVAHGKVDSGEIILLQDSQVATLTKALDADELSAELHRALKQVRQRINKQAEEQKKGGS